MTVQVTVIRSSAVEPTLWDQILVVMPAWFQQGGMVMWLLLLTSFLISIVTLERTYFWANYLLKKERLLINDCFAALNKNDKQQALIFCQNLQTPALKVLKQGINLLPFSPQEHMQYYATHQVNCSTQGQSLLRGAIFVALILGILGTLLGLIDSLYTLSLHRNITLSTLLVAISQALISSAFSLCIALLAFIPYRIFHNQSARLKSHLQKVISQFNTICQRQALISNHISDIMELQRKHLKGAFKNTETVAEHSEMPYHYEFKEGSDEVNVSLHKEMQDIHKTSQSSLIDMYKEQPTESCSKKLQSTTRLKK